MLFFSSLPWYFFFSFSFFFFKNLTPIQLELFITPGGLRLLQLIKKNNPQSEFGFWLLAFRIRFIKTSFSKDSLKFSFQFQEPGKRLRQGFFSFLISQSFFEMSRNKSQESQNRDFAKNPINMKNTAKDRMAVFQPKERKQTNKNTKTPLGAVSQTAGAEKKYCRLGG